MEVQKTFVGRYQYILNETELRISDFEAWELHMVRKIVKAVTVLVSGKILFSYLCTCS